MRRTPPARSAATSMRSVDVHTHVLPPELPRWSERFGYGGFVQLVHEGGCKARMGRDGGPQFPQSESNACDPALRLRESREAGALVLRWHLMGHDPSPA